MARGQSDPHRWTVSDLVARTDTFFVASQVRDPSGAWRGVMVTEIVPDGLMEHVIPPSMGGGVFTVLDGRGRQLYRYPPASQLSGGTPLPSFDSLTARALSTKQVQVATGGNLSCPTRAFCVAVPVPELGWTVTIARPEAEFARSILLALLQQGVAFALVGLVAFLLAAAVARRVSARVEALGDFAHAVGRGELPPPEVPRAPREIRHLTQALNHMAGKLHARHAEHARVLELERDAAREAARLGSYPRAHRDPVGLF